VTLEGSQNRISDVALDHAFITLTGQSVILGSRFRGKFSSDLPVRLESCQLDVVRFHVEKAKSSVAIRNLKLQAPSRNFVVRAKESELLFDASKAYSIPDQGNQKIIQISDVKSFDREFGKR
jgi:hypothetical protein